MLGARRLARSTCSRCVTCRRAAAKGSNQLMGQLPSATSHPFQTTGVDYAGPFLLKLGRVRKPVMVKSYLAIFVCFSTKAVHIEVVSDLSTEAFLSTLRRFVARRGLPSTVYSDNGSNFIGAHNDLFDLYRFLESSDVLTSIQSFLLSNKISWHHSPERAPHFGGLWEAAVKSTKHHLKRVVGSHPLTFEEFTTVATQIEAYLNSRPLGPLTSHSPDGMAPLTPGHFLVGRPLLSYPCPGNRPTTNIGSCAKPWCSIFGAGGLESTSSTCKSSRNGEPSLPITKWGNWFYSQMVTPLPLNG